MTTESLENFLMTIAPPRRRRLLCLSDRHELPRLESEYEHCNFFEDVVSGGAGDEWDLIFCGDLNIVQAGLQLLYPGCASPADMVKRLAQTLAPGGRLVIGVDNLGMNTWSQVLGIRSAVRANRHAVAGIYAACPSATRPQLLARCERACLRWFFAHLYPAPRSLLKKLLYRLFVMLGLMVLFVPAYILVVER